MNSTLLAVTFVTLGFVQNQQFVRAPVNGGGALDAEGHSQIVSGDQDPLGMVLVPGGETIIGTDPDDVERLGQRDQIYMTRIAAETPRHSTPVEDFYIDVTEVTNIQWKVFLDATGRKPSDVLVEYGWPPTADHPEGTIPEGQETYPITNVNMPEIQEYLEWCGKRLPTEEEWTRAARGDDDRVYPWGSRWNHQFLRSGADVPHRPVPVGGYPTGASPFGVLDMAGNVWEWVDSPFAQFEGYKPISIKQGRKSYQLTPEFDRTRKVAKGGFFEGTRDDVRIDSRLSLNPNDSDAGLGFRGARSERSGLESIRHGYRRMLPSQIPRETDLDVTDVFSAEATEYQEMYGQSVITGHRFLSFAHPVPSRRPSMSRLQRETVDEPLTLGLLVTSEQLESPALPAGEYVVAWKYKGESKAYKAKKKEERRSSSSRDRKEEEPPPPPPPADGAEGVQGAVPGATAPWPGIPINDIVEDIDFPQDQEVVLFYNVNNAVVAWMPSADVIEQEKAPIQSTASPDGREWTIAFSLDTVTRKVPRFTLPLRLRGQGLPAR